jgi:hypothetical protein
VPASVDGKQGYSQRLPAHALIEAQRFSAGSLAMLFCRDELVAFYRHQGWQLVD